MRDLINGEISNDEVAGIPTLIVQCAGTSIPKLFLEQPTGEFKWQMDVNYMGTVNLMQPCAQLFVKHKIKDAHLVMVASVLCYFGLVGYASYSPTKFALRGLSECIRQEL